MTVLKFGRVGLGEEECVVVGLDPFKIRRPDGEVLETSPDNVRQLKFYGSTDQFPTIVERMQKYLPSGTNLLFNGTVKLHGTNTGVILTRSGDLIAVSRSQIVEPGAQGHYGWAEFVRDHDEFFRTSLQRGLDFISDADYIMMTGEYAGPGIAKGSGVSKLPRKMFFPFALWEPVSGYIPLLNSSEDFNITNDHDIFEIGMFKQFHVNIVNSEEGFKAAKQQLDEWVAEVDKQCPVADYFGITGVGEGIVFTLDIGDEVTRGIIPPEFVRDYTFKAKGHTHSVVRTDDNGVEITPTKAQNAAAFAKMVCTGHRFNQFYNDEITQDDFAAAIVSDSLTEEYRRMQMSELTPEDISPEITKRAKGYWHSRRKNLAGT